MLVDLAEAPERNSTNKAQKARSVQESFPVDWSKAPTPGLETDPIEIRLQEIFNDPPPASLVPTRRLSLVHDFAMPPGYSPVKPDSKLESAQERSSPTMVSDHRLERDPG